METNRPNLDQPVSPQVALRCAVDLVGTQAAMGRLLGVSQRAVWRWLNHDKPLPAEHVLKVEAATGISRHLLRPDLYPRDDAAAAHDQVKPQLGSVAA